MIVRNLAAVTTLALSIGLLAGCSQQQLSTGPMNMGGDQTAQCMNDVRPVVAKRIGGDFFKVTGEAQAVIEKIEFVDPTNMVMDQNYLIPVKTGELPFGFVDYPTHLPAWKRREISAGARVKPHTEMNVVFVTHRPDRSFNGQAKGIQITYSVDGVTHVKRNTTSYEIGDCTGQ